jgi:hypothetical protein
MSKNGLHVHRFTLRQGKQVVSSADKGNPHTHVVEGVVTSSNPEGKDHIHKVTINAIEIESGPPVVVQDSEKEEEVVNKAIMPDMVDPNHFYIFKTGEYGIYDYWYMDQQGNYWKYTNAPEDHIEFDPHAGVPLLVREQPMPGTSPSFFTPEGRKRHIAVPPDVQTTPNESYNPLDTKDIWYEMYEKDKQVRYVYLDADIRENVDLWVQYQLRIADSSIPRLRKFAVTLFNKTHPKDKIIGAMMMLMDQGLYGLEELIEASVGNVEFIDNTIKLLGRKFICDPVFLDFMTSLIGERDHSAPLFLVDTAKGRDKLGRKHLYSIFHYLKVSPTYLMCWHASHMFSRIVNRLSFEKPELEELEGRAFSELQRIFGTDQDIQYMVDFKVKQTLLNNYKATVAKGLSLPRATSDEYGTLVVFSDLNTRKEDEMEFSEWLHAEPLHDAEVPKEAANG